MPHNQREKTHEETKGRKKVKHVIHQMREERRREKKKRELSFRYGKCFSYKSSFSCIPAVSLLSSGMFHIQ